VERFTESCVVGAAATIRELTVGQALAEAAMERPTLVGLIDGAEGGSARRRWTFAELYELAQQGAMHLLSEFTPGERIAIWAPSSAEWIQLYFSAALAGLTVVPLDPASRAKELGRVLAQAKVSGIYLAPTYRGTDLFSMLASVRRECPELRSARLLTDWRNAEPSGQANRALPTVDASHTSLILYPASSVATPKGAMIHHRGIINNAHFIANRLGLSPGEVWINQMPLFHIAGIQINVLGALTARASQLVCNFDPGKLLALIDEERVGVMIGAPTMFAKMLDHQEARHRDLHSLRILAIGGSVPCPPELAERLEARTGATLVSFWGMTEMGGMSLQTSPHDSYQDRTGTIGCALPCSDVRVADPCTDITLPVGKQGELRVRGYHQMKGYFEQPQQTSMLFDSTGWIRSGDRGWMDERGYFHLMGPMQELIIRGSEKIDPGEIEAVLCSHPAVQLTSVIGLPDPVYGQTVAAVVQTHPGMVVSEAALSTHCREVLAAYKAPSRIFFMERLPVLSSGQVDRRRLIEILFDGNVHGGIA